MHLSYQLCGLGSSLTIAAGQTSHNRDSKLRPSDQRMSHQRQRRLTLRNIVDRIEHPWHHNEEYQAIHCEFGSPPFCGRCTSRPLLGLWSLWSASRFGWVYLRRRSPRGSREASVEGLERIESPKMLKQRHDMLAAQIRDCSKSNDCEVRREDDTPRLASRAAAGTAASLNFEA